ncbi:MAG: methyltransferase domain-containing protein [Deltaproteobacteria bacterium]|nr:methyltransferase domain-containing protein [Deltaproteobacteria bacterium]
MTDTESTSKAVALQYNRFPYPHYPIFAKPLWQEGYWGSSLFIGRLLYDLRKVVPPALSSDHASHRILNAGCGDTQPYVLRKLEPSHFHIDCVDLSRTALRRAKLRTFPYVYKMSFHEQDLLAYTKNRAEEYDHIEAYGVLHHLEDPDQTLKQMVRCLKPNGTLRIMVYNSPARRWIHELQDLFQSLNFSPYRKADRAAARSLLAGLRGHCPSFSPRLAQISPLMLSNDARFVDTFFHAHELRRSIVDWFASFHRCGLEPFALFDRYAELDDLPNPLWELPQAQVLEERARANQFRNNLELLLYKRGHSHPHAITFPKLWHWRLKPAPRFWTQYEETAKLSFFDRLRIWHQLIGSLCGHQGSNGEKLPTRVEDRLARIGALCPR